MFFRKRETTREAGTPTLLSMLRKLYSNSVYLSLIFSILAFISILLEVFPLDPPKTLQFALVSWNIFVGIFVSSWLQPLAQFLIDIFNKTFDLSFKISDHSSNVFVCTILYLSTSIWASLDRGRLYNVVVSAVFGFSASVVAVFDFDAGPVFACAVVAFFFFLYDLVQLIVDVGKYHDEERGSKKDSAIWYFWGQVFWPLIISAALFLTHVIFDTKLPYPDLAFLSLLFILMLLLAIRNMVFGLFGAARRKYPERQTYFEAYATSHTVCAGIRRLHGLLSALTVVSGLWSLHFMFDGIGYEVIGSTFFVLLIILLIIPFANMFRSKTP